MYEKRNNKLILPANPFLIIILSVLALLTLIMAIYGIDGKIPQTPVWVATAGCIVCLFENWKGFELSASGITTIRFGLFRNKTPWPAVFQVVDLSNNDRKKRTSFLVILCTAQTSEKFRNHDSADSFILANGSHAFLIDYSESEKEALQKAIEQYWGKIDYLTGKSAV